jgi:beta-glucosidase
MALADFRSVDLPPGRSLRVSLRIDERALSYWSEAEGSWVALPATRTVYVGSSSRDIRLRGTTEG